MKAMIRCKGLDMSGLASQEAHGKREDRTSLLRIVREISPLVMGSLNLRDCYDEHMVGVKQNVSAKKPVLHFLLRFPPEVLDGDGVGPFAGRKSERQRMMLKHAIAFVQQTHGGDAVFAARLDRDEAGETIVDVFASPRYEKRTKRTDVCEDAPVWASATKFGKELAKRHLDEIRRRHPDAKAGSLTSPRMVGIALNTEFRMFVELLTGVELTAKVEKETAKPDRLEVEAFKRLRNEEHLAYRRIDVAESQNAKERAELNTRRSALEIRSTAIESLAQRVISATKLIAERLKIPIPRRLSVAILDVENALGKVENKPASSNLATARISSRQSSVGPNAGCSF